MSGLDPVMTAEMYHVIANLNHTDGITVVMISHDIASALKYATHILHIGKEIFFGTGEEYLASDLGRGFAEGKGEAENE